jgi:hypothetical protein
MVHREIHTAWLKDHLDTSAPVLSWPKSRSSGWMSKASTIRRPS